MSETTSGIEACARCSNGPHKLYHVGAGCPFEVGLVIHDPELADILIAKADSFQNGKRQGEAEERERIAAEMERRADQLQCEWAKAAADPKVLDRYEAYICEVRAWVEYLRGKAENPPGFARML